MYVDTTQLVRQHTRQSKSIRQFCADILRRNTKKVQDDDFILFSSNDLLSICQGYRLYKYHEYYHNIIILRVYVYANTDI